MSEDNSIQNETSAQEQGFTFRRMGGIDQLALANDEEWRNLGKLDDKLWMALSCPTAGLEYNADTIAILDADKDGRIRVSDVKDAVAWLCERYEHPATLINPDDGLAPNELRNDTEAGEAIAGALASVMKKNGDAEKATLEQIDAVLAEASGYPFNGDGIVPPDSAPDKDSDSSGPDLRAFILKAIEVVGAKRDASGKPGLDADLAGEFYSRLDKIRSWRASLAGIKLPLAENTADAWDLLSRLAPKLDEFFSLCQLTAYAPDTGQKLNEEIIGQNIINFSGDGESKAMAARLLALPLAKINEDGKLDLEKGVNPAWTNEINSFRELFAPMLKTGVANSTDLTQKKWTEIRDTFAEYASILQKKPVYGPPPANAEAAGFSEMPELVLAPANDSLKRDFLPDNPDGALDSITDAEITALLAHKAGFAELVEKDKNAPPLASFKDLRKLALYKLHLYTFLMNFLSFMDFYEPDKKAIFQTGVLYLDSRECMLCVPVTDVEAHATLAAQSHLCLVYCACSRKNTDGSESNATIAAAMTVGTVATLINGRHGLFIDNEGREWDSSIVKIVHNPISLREAMWAPYLRISAMAGEQAQKFLSSKAKSATDATTKAVSDVAAAAKEGQPKQGFDFAKGAGIFAALSVAVSVLSAAFAYIANSLVSLGWWWPLALVVIFLCISGPSMIIAWFKLRKRNLGPLLDASGWAINKGAPINLVLGAALTTAGKLPPNAVRDFNDPYSLPARMRARKRKAWFWIILLVLVLALIGGFALYCKLFGEPLWFFTFRAMIGV